MMTLCPHCRFATVPYEVSEPQDGLVVARYRCRCGKRWRDDRWSVLTWSLWRGTGGQLADPSPEPADTGIVIVSERDQ